MCIVAQNSLKFKCYSIDKLVYILYNVFMINKSSTAVVTGLAALAEGLPQPQPHPRHLEKAAKCVVNFWLDEAAKLYSNVQDRFLGNRRPTAIAIGKQALDIPSGNVHVVPVGNANLAHEPNVIDRSDPAFWAKPAEVYDWAQDHDTAKSFAVPANQAAELTFEQSVKAVADASAEALVSPATK